MAVIGIVAVVAFALAGWMLARSSNAGTDRQVLVAVDWMPAGHVVTSSDLAESSAGAGDLDLIDSANAADVIGRTLALPVAAGTPLTPSMIGAAASPEVGRAETTLALPDGFYPAGIEPGQSMILVAGAASGAAAVEQVWQMPAVVRTVEFTDGGVLVGLEFDAAHRAGLALARGSEPFLVAWTADASAESGG